MQYTEAWFKIKTIGLIAIIAIVAGLTMLFLCAIIYATFDAHRKRRYLLKHGYRRHMDLRSIYGKGYKYSWSNGKRSRTEEEITEQSYKTLKSWVEADEG